MYNNNVARDQRDTTVGTLHELSPVAVVVVVVVESSQAFSPSLDLEDPYRGPSEAAATVYLVKRVGPPFLGEAGGLRSASPPPRHSMDLASP